MTTIDTILAEVEALKTEHERFVNKGVKASASRARKHAQNLIKAARAIRVEIQTKKNEMNAK